MDFIDHCKQLADRIVSLKEQILTEEATKNAFIMPFIQMLGYDIFNPLEVIPEMDCDIAKKKGEKIDYAIVKDGEPIILIECKHWKQDLSLHDTQLQRYYAASKARFGLLTNGIKYRFYADLEKSNIMDTKPFLDIDFENLKDSQVEDLKKFHKSYFDISNILNSASELKVMSELKSVIKAEFTSPSPELVRHLTKQVYTGIINQKVLDQFTELVKRSFANHINEVISERLNVAIKSTEEPTTPTTTEQTPEEPTSKIITTAEELESYYMIKGIVRSIIPAERVTYRDAQSYFAIFIDDNNRKPLCRLYLNKTQWSIGLFNEDKSEVKHKITTLDDIYQFHEELKATASRYI